MIKAKYSAAITDKPKWWLNGGLAVDSCVAAWACKGANSLEDSYNNLVNPAAYRFVPTGSPTFSSADGLILGSSDVYVSTTITEPLSSGAFTAIVRIKDRAAASGVCGNSAFTGVKWFLYFGVVQLGGGEVGGDYASASEFFQGAVGYGTVMHSIRNNGSLSASRMNENTAPAVNTFLFNRASNFNGAGLTLMAAAFYKVGLSQRDIYSVRTAMMAL